MKCVYDEAAHGPGSHLQTACECDTDASAHDEPLAIPKTHNSGDARAGLLDRCIERRAACTYAGTRRTRRRACARSDAAYRAASHRPEVSRTHNRNRRPRGCTHQIIARRDGRHCCNRSCPIRRRAVRYRRARVAQRLAIRARSNAWPRRGFDHSSSVSLRAPSSARCRSHALHRLGAAQRSKRAAYTDITNRCAKRPRTGHSYIPNRGGADLDITVGQLSKVPRQDAAAFLRMAPGLMLTNQGGTGHPYQIFLRGFDAREGQDIEFAVDGIPINEVGNPHGNGLADTHFILPELVQSLRVIEGPYAPQQGNFAVAGSALYDVGLKDPGLTAKAMYGSFGTKRLVLLWKPSSATSHTFAGAELFSSSGFGQNRASSRATAMAGYEIPLGRAASLRLLATSYATGYQQAGVLREDDVLSGRKGFYDTNDTTQGGDVARHSVGMTLDAKDGDMRYMQSVFATYRASRIRQNFTGFREDPQQSWQSTHPQRGDLIDQQSTAVTVGARGSARHRFRAFERPQDLEFGYFARFDSVDGLQQRDRADTNIPYRGELDLSSSMSNLGLYVDASIKPLAWLTVRGGARADLFHYKVTNRCAVTTRSAIAGGVPDTECFSADRQGYRSPDQTATAVTTVLQPRAVVLMGPWDGITISASYGRGTRSLDPQYVNQGAETPFATVHSGELGVLWNKSMGAVTASIRTAFFSTYVDRDLFFNQTEGRNTLANGTSRTGFSAYSRFTGKFFDVAGSVTLVKSRFDDTGLAVPYSPGFVARLDGTVFGDTSLKLADHAIEGSIGAGISIVGPRPLPFNERTNVQGLIDIAASAKWRSLSLGATCTNLLGREYRLGEFNYTSDFRSRDYPTQVAARHFSAGEPRAVYLTLGITLAPSTDRPPSPAAAPSTPATSLERKTP
jgi:iron complex outermembrane recepter protein